MFISPLKTTWNTGLPLVWNYRKQYQDSINCSVIGEVVHLSMYGCIWKVCRALEKLEKHLPSPRASHYAPLMLSLRQPDSGESGWRIGHQSRLPTLRPGIEFTRALRFVYLNLSPRVFLRVLRFSFLCKFDFHANIWAFQLLNINLAVERLNINLARKKGQPLLSQLTLNKVYIYLYLFIFPNFPRASIAP